MEIQGEIILYQPDKEVKLEVRLENETVWLSIDEMSQLFGRDIKNVKEFMYIKEIIIFA